MAFATKTSPKGLAWDDGKSDGGDDAGPRPGAASLTWSVAKPEPTCVGPSKALLTDDARPGAPGKFTPEQVTRILAVACEPPEKSGRPITHWTAFELADEVVKRGIVASISTSQVGRYLREAAMQPHKSRYWLNTTEKDPEKFREQVETVCDTYLAAPERERTQNTHTVCVDEMTGIQALERTAATKPMIAGKPARIEFEYERHGTLTLIGNFQVTTGELIAPTFGPSARKPTSPPISSRRWPRTRVRRGYS